MGVSLVDYWDALYLTSLSVCGNIDIGFLETLFVDYLWSLKDLYAFNWGHTL